MPDPLPKKGKLTVSDYRLHKEKLEEAYGEAVKKMFANIFDDREKLWPRVWELERIKRVYVDLKADLEEISTNPNLSEQLEDGTYKGRK